MSGSNKILTVSYGTFSCTLEGFEDPFNSMRSIAEYFRDLAADDRYFGAEPPTPDVEMLQALAERGTRGRVAARLSDTGVALTVREPAPEPSVGTPAPSDDDDGYTADEPEDALVLAETHPRHDTPAETIAEKLSRIRAVVSRQQAPMSREEFIDDGLAAEPPRSRALTRTLADIAADISGEDYLDEVVTSEAQADTAEAEWSAFDDAEDAPRDVASAEDAPPMKMTEDRDESADEDFAGGVETAAGDEPAQSDDDFGVQDAADMPAAAQAEDASDDSDDEDEDEDEDDFGRDDFMARAAAYADRNEQDFDTDGEPASAVADDASSDSFDPEPNAFFSPDGDTVATGDTAEIADEPETEDEAFAFSDSDDDDEAPAFEDLAASGADADADAEDDDAPDFADHADQDDDADAMPASAYRRESRLLDPVDDGDAGVGRLMSKTEGKLADDDSVRRRRVISQMRAAVAATRADRILSSMSQRREDAASADEPYRRDLDRVVSTPRERTPLMLVSALRVDDDKQLPAAKPSRDSDEGFARFAAEMNARALTELLEAAAAYSAFVEGEPHFSRPDLMRRVADHAGDLRLSREQGLRSFGQLLREGKIRKLQRGQFTIDESTRYNPAHRIAGE